MKTNNLAFLFVIIVIYHERQEITISNAFFTFLIQESQEKLQEIYSQAPSNKKSFLSRSGSGWGKSWRKGTALGFAARSNQLGEKTKYL